VLGGFVFTGILAAALITLALAGLLYSIAIPSSYLEGFKN